ncbi:MAG: hypothetical protein K0B15_14005 [Lentimicrobium sp.]|nr:hypothetical protein [Lentimicrobium sp.]
MKKLIPAMICLTLLLTGGCEEDEYNDGQYGPTCFIGSLSIDKGPTTTFEYDQYDMITSVRTTMNGISNSEVNFIYKTNMAFADFYVDGQLVGQSEATLDSFGNIVSVQYSDNSGRDLGDLQYNYNCDHQPVSVSFYNFALNRVETLTIEWYEGNAIRFTSGNTNHRCTFIKNKKSTLKVGKGNVFLQAQFFDANIGMFLSKDQMETYNADSHEGEALQLRYDTDSDWKIRKIYWSATSAKNFGTTTVEYNCHN